MRIDMHVHLADLEAFLADRGRRRPFLLKRFLDRACRRALADQSSSGDKTNLNDTWISTLAGWVRESQLDKIVVLALDAVFDESGRACPEKTVLHVKNEFVCSVAAKHPDFMFGASIHPYRKDAVEELGRLVKQGACLIKWLPSGQHIQPDNPKCQPFYEALVHYGIPLLTHTGVEHSLGSRRSYHNHPDRLVPALEQGVTVIAAHCGVHLFLHEPSFFKAWASLAGKYTNLYGDLGAFSSVTRIPCLRRIISNKELCARVFYGSDFPGIPSPMWCWQLGLKKMRELSQIDNPLERNVRVMQALGVPAETFERVQDLLCVNRERD